jgi:ABC-type sugar transport system substrate-binding protein
MSIKCSHREDDVAGQIDLREVVDRGYAGIIISPDQTLPLRSPSAVLFPVEFPWWWWVNLGIAPSAKLSYILNDEVAGGQLAARRVGKILQEKVRLQSWASTRN